ATFSAIVIFKNIGNIKLFIILYKYKIYNTLWEVSQIRLFFGVKGIFISHIKGHIF
ncbi:hypothetical protein, partial [Plasmodium yoelii yoelii]